MTDVISHDEKRCETPHAISAFDRTGGVPAVSLREYNLFLIIKAINIAEDTGGWARSWILQTKSYRTTPPSICSMEIIACKRHDAYYGVTQSTLARQGKA